MSEWKLRLPGGIQGDTGRALLGLLDRWDTIGVERVLVWHLASVVPEALPHLAAGIGVDKVSFVGGPPRELLQRGIALLRNIGPEEPLMQALEAIGYARADLLLREDTVLRYDGSFAYAGEPHREGADSHWAIWWLYVAAPGGLSSARVLELWDMAVLMRPLTRPPVLVIESASGTTVYRARSEITS